ncbi:hypothetical protein ACTQ50_17060, partial [Blautia sp. Sow4_E7]|uniref:hypothetical protein n=1 Tax=Blautia sp. Sow4_E7 TaxID=3438749 RepID=UPI003F914F1D
EHSQIFVDFEKNKKKRSFKRKMVLGITPNTKFVYSLKQASGYLEACLTTQIKYDIFTVKVLGSSNNKSSLYKLNL